MLWKPGQLWKDKIHMLSLICGAGIRDMQENGSKELWEKNRTSRKRKEDTIGE